ncbi:glycosyl transferase possibly involved in lipopolysaccharide synthesis [Thermanaerovibrio velox DSM 12556]|uniref:Glycosyl transferase possibly involved in lipopolysaccharide synthesis n=1 Tax=Thermanaerovibrio velox DSM 12556 TaxID=926567 RepID=H0UMV0_9BACT|nr:sugar transferase [Thermanaerovibrio velox]EHM09245.1 glycosyl transferase possibly involved in lipopolysaccharide synthesis [Thermanaerovibrio velox DSM 12556]
MIYRRFLKRILDVALASAGICLLWPVMLITAILVRVKLGSPVLFKQARPGLNGKRFVMYKFRTMRYLCDASGKPLPDEERLTRFGRILRSTSLDELPELFNVLKGDMSIVGPRPLLMKYLPLYTPRQMRRHEVRPGITGWAQVNGRNAVSWEDRLEMDVWYVDNMSFILDVKIILLTFLKVLRREGISQQGRATVDEFKGGHET